MKRWIGFRLPGRHCRGTYDVYENQPPVDCSEYQNVSLDNLRCLEECASPTSCYVERDGDVFYRDQQDCVVWSLRDGQVYANDDMLVADSLAEFCARMILESKIWFAAFMPNRYAMAEDPPGMLAYVQALKGNNEAS